MSNPYITDDDLKNLPQELLDQLVLNVKQEYTANLICLIGELGEASMDKIIIAYYKKHNKIIDRKGLTQKLYHLKARGSISYHPTKKGVYIVAQNKQAVLDE